MRRHPPSPKGGIVTEHLHAGDHVRFRAKPAGGTFVVIEVATAMSNEGDNTFVRVAMIRRHDDSKAKCKFTAPCAALAATEAI